MSGRFSPGLSWISVEAEGSTAEEHAGQNIQGRGIYTA